MIELKKMFVKKALIAFFCIFQNQCVCDVEKTEFASYKENPTKLH